MKKKLAVFLSLVLIVGLLFMGNTSETTAFAKAAQVSLKLPDKVKKEEEFTVRVAVDSDISLYSVQAAITYDVDCLEYVPSNDCVEGTAGVLQLRDTYDEETNEQVYDITFKALETGTAQIGLEEIYLIEYAQMEYLPVTPSVESVQIGINKRVEQDASLAELLVAPGNLTESFSPDCLEYEMHVGLEVTTVGISAIPMAEDSVVDLQMPETLAEGDNLITITVTALSGKEMQYSIHVIRDVWPETTMEDTEEMTTTEEATVEPDREETVTEEMVNTTESETTTEVTTETTTEAEVEVSKENVTTEENRLEPDETELTIEADSTIEETSQQK